MILAISHRIYASSILDAMAIYQGFGHIWRISATEGEIYPSDTDHFEPGTLVKFTKDALDDSLNVVDDVSDVLWFNDFVQYECRIDGEICDPVCTATHVRLLEQSPARFSFSNPVQYGKMIECSDEEGYIRLDFDAQRKIYFPFSAFIVPPKFQRLSQFVGRRVLVKFLPNPGYDPVTGLGYKGSEFLAISVRLLMESFDIQNAVDCLNGLLLRNLRMQSNDDQESHFENSNLFAINNPAISNGYFVGGLGFYANVTGNFDDNKNL